MKIVKNIILLTCAVLVMLSIPVLLKHDQPIYVDIPEIKAEEVKAIQEAQEKATEKAERSAAARAEANRLSGCVSDEECVIVDKSPCGCILGAKGVIAINVRNMVDYNNKVQEKALNTICPDNEPSQEGVCGPTAQAVCRNKVCKIVF